MEHDGKNKIWYKGIIPTCFVLIIVPILLVLLFYFPMQRYLPENVKTIGMNLVSSKFLGHLLGCAFHISCSISGAFTTARQVTKDRWAEFVENLPLSLGFALKGYFHDIKENGFAYFLYAVIVLTNIYICVSNLFIYITVYM